MFTKTELDDHRFSLLHWASREGHSNIVDMLIARGARLNATNMGNDTPLHLAAAHGHREVVLTLVHNKANINAVNEHGNTALHYACFWGYDQIAEDLVNNGALVNVANKFDIVPLEKARPPVTSLLKDRAVALGQDMSKIPFKDHSWMGYKTRSRDALLSRHTGISIKQLKLFGNIAFTHSGQTVRGRWEDNDIVAKFLNVRELTKRVTRDFIEEFSRLRIFNNQNVLPALACCNQPPDLVVISQYMPLGSLYSTLHGESGLVVDQNQTLRFAIDIARGMEFLHSIEPKVSNFTLTSKHIMIDDDLTTRINMADYKFSFHEKGKSYSPAWMAPEALQRSPDDVNGKAADMWSFAILLWELETRQVPFSDLCAMEVGMKVALEWLRLSIPPGISSHMSRLMTICMNEEPGKRPHFNMIIPILEKMKSQ